MKYLNIPALYILVAVVPGHVLATPSVSGNTISWPDDGWYQVQINDGTETLCNGGRDCEVPPGVYLVINHSTGDRFNNIHVEGPGGELTPIILVSGNTISWPDNGWYQVQSNDGTETFCNGGRSCEVQTGTYLLINHSTGERFSGIRVEGLGDTLNPDISVFGNTISWPDNGWYQVQSNDGTQNFCSGGRSCEVPAGTYLVINHSTGERFNNILVEGLGGDVDNIRPEDEALLADVPDILNASMLSGFFYRGRDLVRSVQSTEYLADTHEEGGQTAVLTSGEPIVFDDRYVCPNGGELFYEDTSGGGSGDVTGLGYYDTCQFDDGLINGRFRYASPPGFFYSETTYDLSIEWPNETITLVDVLTTRDYTAATTRGEQYSQMNDARDIIVLESFRFTARLNEDTEENQIRFNVTNGTFNGDEYVFSGGTTSVLVLNDDVSGVVAGYIAFDFEDGRRLTIEPSVDPQSYNAQLLRNDGTLVEKTLPWSDVTLNIGRP